MNKYLNLVNDNWIKITDDEYQNFLTPLALKLNKILKVFPGFKFEIVSKSSEKNIYFVNFNKGDASLNFFITYLKNSGIKDNDNKRLQIPNKLPNFNKEKSYYCLGIYPNGIKNDLFLISDITGHALRSEQFTSYSSFWSHINDLKKSFVEGSFTNIINKIHEHVYFTENNLNYGYNYLINRINELVPISSEIFLDLKDFDSSKSKTVEIIRYERDSRFRDYVLHRDNFQCKLCKTKESFLDRNLQLYFEAHHIIPYNASTQKNFRLSLDHPFNMVCLCPNCHKKIHNSSINQTQILLQEITKNLSDFNNIFLKELSYQDLTKLYF
jgi:hypothetical protein